MMRVITGIARGRRLETLPGDDVTRPTTESVKEALFSMLQFEIEGKRILDLFAGSGQLGIEALSRGADFCTFVENSRKAKAVVENNILHCGFESSSRVVMCDALSFLSGCEKYDIAFLDPPYYNGLIDKAVAKLAPHMNDNGIIVCETARDEVLPDMYSDFACIKSKCYGRIKLTLYRKDSNINENRNLSRQL